HCVDHSEQLDDEVDAIERTKRVAHGGQKSKPDEPGAPVAFIDADLGAELAGQRCSVCVARALAGEIQKIAREPVGQIVGGRLRHGRQDQAQFLQSRFGTHELLLSICDSAQFSIRDTLYRKCSSTVAPTRWASIQSNSGPPRDYWCSGRASK